MVVKMSEKNLYYSVLYDYYSGLLKENQALAIDLYYNQDFSLSEIAEELGISRAGIHDTLKRAEKNLLEFEDKLSLHKKFEKYISLGEKIVKAADKIKDERFSKEVEIIKKAAIEIINEG